MSAKVPTSVCLCNRICNAEAELRDQQDGVIFTFRGPKGLRNNNSLYRDDDKDLYDEVITDIKQAFFPETNEDQVIDLENRFMDALKNELKNERNNSTDNSRAFQKECGNFLEGTPDLPYSDDFLKLLNKKVFEFLRTCGQDCYKLYENHKENGKRHLPFASRYFEYTSPSAVQGEGVRQTDQF